MNKNMSIQEIESAFEAEWVLIGDPETTENLEVRRGTVLVHSKDRDEVYRRAIELKPRHSAILYTGKSPEGAVVIL